MSEKPEVSFSEIPKPAQAAHYVEKTLKDGMLFCQVKWSFDEAQADSFHKGWNQEHFKKCLEIMLRGRA